MRPRPGGAYQPRTGSSNTKKVRVNGEIRVPQVRLIGPEREQLGVLSLTEALRQAQQAGLDLVEIAPTAAPPVCRIMDYGKYLFELNKQKAAQKKKQKRIQLKEVKFRPVTEEGDYQVKLRNLIRFLEQGDKAKITVRFRGREIAHVHLGTKLIERLEKDLAAYAAIDDRPKMEGKQMVLVVSPKKTK
ncbi:translation initiation factor IF-3 [Candidatus Rickettsiella viridis]|uniref:translation initiation factor IF-3 n=1 Tax=Candidatus Rickettsiella viridis TaxID=676208 RepID=UPI000F847FE8|nr:translation initiation factor IF-3 [Candidatus Rickettsiella viridis]